MTNTLTLNTENSTVLMFLLKSKLYVEKHGLKCHIKFHDTYTTILSFNKEFLIMFNEN